MPGAESYLSPAAQAILGRYGDLIKTRIEDVKQQNAADNAYLNTATQAYINKDRSTYDKATQAGTKSWQMDEDGNLQPNTQVFNQTKPNNTVAQAAQALEEKLKRQQEWDAQEKAIYAKYGQVPPVMPVPNAIPPGYFNNQNSNAPGAPVNGNTNNVPPPPVPQNLVTRQAQNTQPPTSVSDLTAEDLNNARIADYLKRNDYNNMLQILKGSN